MAGGHKILNEHAIAVGAEATRTWRELWQQLMVTEYACIIVVVVKVVDAML